MNKKAHLAALIAATLVFAPACRRKGCTDSDAENFDLKAKKDNNSCVYRGSTVIWYGKNYSQGIQLEGATSLRYYVDNMLVGSTAADVYFTGPPACGQEGSITVTKDLGEVKGRSYPFRVEDQLGRIFEEGILQVDAGKCSQVELSL